ncbi:MAG: LLM class oxidoreductase [Pseudomonadota bacterium]
MTHHALEGATTMTPRIADDVRQSELGGGETTIGTDFEFDRINPAYTRVFQASQLTVGLVVPVENYAHQPAPNMDGQVEAIQQAEALGFSALWLRDIPMNVPSFGDVGQVYDPFVYLGMLAGNTSKIALGVASIVLPLRHPAHVAKSAFSVDALSHGRLLLGIASGDRPEEYPAFAADHETRGRRFRESYDYLRQVEASWPQFSNTLGRLDGSVDLLPKPVGSRLPLLITGSSQQDSQWLAQNGDGWMLYPRSLEQQKAIIRAWRASTAAMNLPAKPAMQPLYIDLVRDAPGQPVPIHLGWRLGVEQLSDLLIELRAAGVNHVALNLRFNRDPIDSTLHRIAEQVLPNLSSPLSGADS